MKALLFFVVVLIALVYPVYAETGSVTVSNTTHANWTRIGAFTSYVTIQTDKMENFTFDTGNFTSFVNYTIFDPYHELTYAQPNEVTTFNIIKNGSGHGVASYSRFLNQLNWVCGGDCVITGQFFTVSYDNPLMFQNVTSSGDPATNGWDFVAALGGAPPPANNTNNTMPMYVYNGSQAGANFANRSLVGFDKAPNTRGLIFSGTFVSGTVTNTYNITYPAQGFYLANISKTGQTIKTKDFLHTQTNNSQGYFAETALNNNSFQVLMPQLDGIYLNVTMGTGDFNNVLINASGSTVVTPTPPPAPIQTLPPAGTSNYIIPNAFNYSLGDTATLFWGIDSSLFNALRQIDIDILRPDGTYDPSNFQNLATDSIANGQVTYQVKQSGTYTAQLNTCLITCFGQSPANKVHLATTTLNVSSPQPFIITPSQVLANQQFNITYSFDTNLTSSVSFGYISMQKSGQGSFEQFQSAVIDTSIHTISNATLHTEGTYTLCLANTGKTTGVCTAVVVVVGSLPPTTNITTSNITLSKSTYMWGEPLQGNYGIDNLNYSRTDGATLFWDIYNTDLGVETMSGFIGTQTEHFSLLIANDNHYLWDGKNVVLDSFFQNGNNQFRIFAQNSTTTVQIANRTFFLGEVNTNGYGIKPDVSTTTQNTAFHILVTSPTSGKVVLIPLSDVSQEQTFLINGSITLTTALSVEGVATMYLYDNIGNQEASNQINITFNPVPPNPSSPFAPSSPEQGAVGVLDGWVAMFNLGINGVSRFLFALIITVIFMLAGALVTRNLGWGTLFGIIPFVFFAFIGYYPLLIDALVVIAIGLKLRFL